MRCVELSSESGKLSYSKDFYDFLSLKVFKSPFVWQGDLKTTKAMN